MLKKLLTTIIVLAATATVWAEGWSVTYYIGGYNDAEIKKSADGKMTLADAIAEVNGKDNPVQKVIISAEEMSAEEVSVLANITQNHVDLSSAKGINDFTSLPACVKYVILPDGMTKEQVNNVGPRFDAAVSMGAHTKTVWRYNTYNTTGIEYTGVRYNETVVGGIAQATGKVSATVSISNPTILYSGKVFYDNSGNAYQTSDDSKSVQLTAYTERYTYNNNGTTRLYPNSSGFYVVSEKGGYVGVQTSSTVTVEKKDVEYTYEKDGVTYEFVYNSYVPNLGKKGNDFYMLEGGSFVDIQTETKWMIDGKSDVYNEENGRLVTNNNIGHVGGTQIPLTKVSAYYVSGTNSVYEGPVRIDGENVYGRRDGGTPIELSLVYYYNDNGTEKEAGEGFYVSYDGKRIAPIKDDYGNNNGDWKPAKKEGDSWYIDYGGGYQLATNVTEDYVYKSIDGSSLYVNWNLWKIYNVSKYGYKYDGTSYEGQVYTEDGKYYGYTDGTEIKLENKITYVKDDNTAYDRAVYTYNNKYFGYDGGNSVELETSEYYTQWGATYPVTENDCKSEDGKKVYVGGTKTLLTPYNKEAYVITVSNVSGYSQNTLFTGRVYNETTGLIGGTETTVTYSAKGYCLYNTDYIIYTGEYITKPVDNFIYGCIDDSVLSPLEAAYRYTYKDPITGETVVYETMEQEDSVTVTHNVELTASEESAGNIHLTAYVSAPGSLKFALARWTDLGNNNAYAAQVGNVTALSLSGDVNFTDIGNEGNTISEYGHVAYWDNSSKTNITPTEKGHADNIMNASPAMNGNALTYIDLEDAVFAVQTDMQFAKVNANIKTVILPTAESMTLIPDNAFNNMHYISDLCIPYNYEVIGSGAFYNTHSLMHIYTTDNPEDDSDNEAIVDNGLNTYTFSANLKQIEGGAANLGGPGATFFGSNIEKVTDIYVLAKTAPLCGASAFASSMAYGNNGFAGDLAHPIGRHNYKNGDKWFVVLHYPSELEGTDEEKNYTDVTRVYTLEDETGAVDGRGHAMMWPKHVEFGQAYRTALDGKLWDGTTTYDTQYQGWHEIVLTGNSLARDYDPQTENTEFVYRDWLTICVPYDLKKSQVLSLLGVDPRQNANEEPGVIYEYVCSRDANGNPIKDSEGNYTFEYKEIKQTNAPLYPDVRALTHVSRSVDNRKMTLHFTKLIEQSEVNLLSEDDSNATVKTHDVTINDTHGQGFTKSELTDDDPVVMKGGHPYLIRAYVPKAWDDKIKNLGMYIMSAASSANHAATEKGAEESELPYQYGACTVQAGSVEMYLPCLKHKVHAFDADVKDDINNIVAKDQHTSFSYTDTSMDDPILYHFIGTYASTNIPQYAYYIGKTKDGVHKFSRTTKTTYTWAPYTAVIVGLSLPTYDTEHFGDKATGSAGSISNIIVKPGVKGDDLKIYVGEDEKLASSGARLSLGGFSDSTITGIVEIETDTVVRINDNKVYSINGQYMGTSLNNLPKGIYIINGQKKVVK